MRRLALTLVALLFSLLSESSMLYAKESIVISSARELSKLSSVGGGTEIVWRNGEYADEPLVISASGTATKPIILRAESDGGVRFTGKSSLRIKGSNIVVRGFVWDNPSLEKGIVVSFDRISSHSLLEECVIKGNKSDMRPENNVKWVSIWGYKNRVERCTFIDKRDLGQILIVRLAKDEKAPQHIVRNCYFTRPNSLLNEKGSRINGQCCIRFGTSDVAQQQAECVVENCCFEQCNGEGEIISSKSCGNIFRNNLFYECQGSLTLRHGNNSQVLDNYFIGNGKPLTAGIRVIGEGHIIKGNYLQGLTKGSGKSRNCAIHLLQGQENAPAGGYQQVKNVVISENIIVNCRYGITANCQRKGCDLPVVASVVERNIIVADDENCSVASEDAPHEIEWRNNTIFGGRQLGLSLGEVDKKPKLPNVKSSINAIRKGAGAAFAK